MSDQMGYQLITAIADRNHGHPRDQGGCEQRPTAAALEGRSGISRKFTIKKIHMDRP